MNFPVKERVFKNESFRENLAVLDFSILCIYSVLL